MFNENQNDHMWVWRKKCSSCFYWRRWLIRFYRPISVVKHKNWIFSFVARHSAWSCARIEQFRNIHTKKRSEWERICQNIRVYHRYHKYNSCCFLVKYDKATGCFWYATNFFEEKMIQFAFKKKKTEILKRR